MSSLDQQLPTEAPRPWPLAPEPEPVFGIPEVAVAFVGMLLALFFCAGAAIVIAHHLESLSRVPPAQLANEPRVLLPAQLAAYLLVLAALWRLFAHHLRIGFFRALHWEWPRRWLRFVVAGALLAVVMQLIAHLLPLPPEAPIDKMLQNRDDAWLMTGFGVLIAPFVEEILFRGLLFPALARRVGAVVSLAVTALLFGAIHANQLAGSWLEVACIVCVGVVLTLVRWRSHSLACSTLTHVGYNGALFVALFIQTRGFTNFPVH
jgi:hypothetical protein